MLQAVSAVQSGGSPTSDVQEVLAAASSPVLRIIIDNMFYPVTLDVLQQVTRFSDLVQPVTVQLGCYGIFTCVRLNIRICVFFVLLTDFLQVWHSHEDNHIHQEQSVPGPPTVQ